MKILVVEDEPKLNKGLVQGLQQRGYAVDFAFDGEEGEKMALLNGYDLIILDIMLPKRDGLSVCGNLRLKGMNMPVLFLTAKDTVSDKITGLDIGADDYMIKPFSFDELSARIRTLLRRPRVTLSNDLRLDGLVLNTRAQSLVVEGKDISLTLREYGLLEYFLRNQGKVVTQQDILDHVWDRFFDSLSNVVSVHVKNLRKKLPKKYATRIQTVWGKGYRLA
jgi:DNA-binding response OmpR family regulator